MYELNIIHIEIFLMYIKENGVNSFHIIHNFFYDKIV